MISAVNKLENEIDDGTRMHGAILGFTSLSADPDIDQAVGQSSGEVLLRTFCSTRTMLITFARDRGASYVVSQSWDC